MSRTLSGLFLVGADNRPRKRKRTNQENPRRVPGQIGKIPGKVPKGHKRTKKEGQVQIGKPPRLKHPRLAALDFSDPDLRASIRGLCGAARGSAGVPRKKGYYNNSVAHLAHQDRTIAIASDFRVDGAKSPESPQKEGVWAQKSQLEIADR